MAVSNERTVVVFGGTGFLGRRVVRHLRKCGFSVRIASRHPDRGDALFAVGDPQLQSVTADIHDEQSIARALAGAYAVVNAVSLYIEHGTESSVHNGSQLKHAKPESRGWSTFQESVLMPPRHRSMSAGVAKANWPSGPRSRMPSSSARR